MRAIIILAMIAMTTGTSSAGGFTSVGRKTDVCRGTVQSCHRTVIGAEGAASAWDDLNSQAELDMIKVQQVVSQRQQAVQIAANMPATMQCDKCIENIGK